MVSGAVPPTAPPKVTLPAVPATKVSDVAPFKAKVKLILAPAGEAPPFVVSNVGAPLITVGPPITIEPPLVVIFPPTLFTVPL